MDFKTVIEQRNRMCENFENKECFGCPLSKKIDEYHTNNGQFYDCYEFIFDFPQAAEEIIANYTKEHPKNPTWHQWLNYVFVHYHGFFNNKSYEEWLDTEINEDLAKIYNIPTKEQIKL